jgi:hypothetical protein
MVAVTVAIVSLLGTHKKYLILAENNSWKRKELIGA